MDCKELQDNSKKIILDLCGGTGAWSMPYKEKGYDVRVITLPWQDVITYEPPDNVYGILAAPMCTEFSYAKTGKRDLEKGMQLVKRCMDIIWEQQYKLPNPNSRTTTLKFWALENPYGLLRHFLGFPAMIYSPEEFGDNYKKRTCIWGHFNLPYKELQANKRKPYELAELKCSDIQFPGNYEWSKETLMSKRAAKRSITPQGFANAFYEANK